MAEKRGFFSRLNRALTEVGIEHFDDDKDWDERVKLPAWQTARLRERYTESKRRGRLGRAVAEQPAGAAARGERRGQSGQSGQRRDSD